MWRFVCELAQEDPSFVGDHLKQFMRQFPQGVTLVTTRYEGQVRGVTISSFTSLSLDPPLVMIAVAKNASSYLAFVKSEFFNIQLLASTQDSIAARFATKIDHDEKFRGLQYAFDSKNNPVIDQALGYLECMRNQVHEVGDHSLIIAKVIGAKILGNSEPLIYHNRKFTTIA